VLFARRSEAELKDRWPGALRSEAPDDVWCIEWLSVVGVAGADIWPYERCA
jgi:hypothetical protein